jgi:AcrR family transcriptional regulator
VPKVSAVHIATRKQQIIDASFRCFARKGFHPTTMHDICTDAGLSAGAVYRYFASKQEIIASACEASQESPNSELLANAQKTPETKERLHGLIDAFFTRLEGLGATILNRALVQVWAEAVINDNVRGVFKERQAKMADGIKEIVTESQRRGDLRTTLDPNAIVQAMFALYDGFRLQKAIDSDLPSEAYVEVVKALLTGALWTGSPPSPTSGEA